MPVFTDNFTPKNNKSVLVNTAKPNLVVFFVLLGTARSTSSLCHPRSVWRRKSLSWGTKLRLFNSNDKSVLLCGAVTLTWRRTKNLDYIMQVLMNICLRQILRIRWPERMYNQELVRKIGQAPITSTIKNRR